MHRPTRSAIVSAMFVVLPLATACQKDDGSAGASTDTTAVAPAPAAPTPPAELVTVNDAFKTGWNNEDDAVLAAQFTDSATVQEDTMHFAGRSQIQTKWIKPNLKDIQKFSTSDETWTSTGADFTSHDKYSIDMMMDKKPMTASGTYDGTWTKGADGVWRISSLVVHPDPMPTTTTGQ